MHAWEQDGGRDDLHAPLEVEEKEAITAVFIN